MLSWLKGFVMGFLAACLVVLWFAWSHHVIRSEDGLKLVKKTVGTFEDIYVDVSSWGALDWIRHRELSKAMGKDALERTRKAAARTGQQLEEEMKRALDDAKKSLTDLVTPPSPDPSPR